MLTCDKQPDVWCRRQRQGGEERRWLGLLRSQPSLPTSPTFSPDVAFAQTIAGGSGAGPGWHGTSGVHTHITNTRIGDVEILERRYPVLVHQFGLRPGSGGQGKWRGGDGVVRDIEFTEGLQVSILSEVRPSWPRELLTLKVMMHSVGRADRTVWTAVSRGQWAGIHG